MDGKAPASVSLLRASDEIEDWGEVRFADEQREEDVVFEGRSFNLPSYLSGFLEFGLNEDNEALHMRKKAEDVYYHCKVRSER